ncbi:MAG: hypothetical protein R3F50_11380 [Gammaproteobacteria bacterium]
MSILATIMDRTQRGQLYEVVPRSSRDLRLRRLYLSESLWLELRAPRSSEAEIQRFADLEADLEVYVNRRQLGPEYLFGLSPRGCGVWEIRSVWDPHIRVFGMFMGKDLFIATHLEMRNDLGPFESQDWIRAKRETKAKIRNLMGPYNPIIDSDVNNLVSGAMNGQYFK